MGAVWKDLLLGDTVDVELPPDVTGQSARVVKVMTTIEAESGVVHNVDFAHPVYTERLGGTTSTATSAALNSVLRKFKSLERKASSGASGTGDHSHPKESVPTVLVASADARQEVKNMADFICDGVDDQEEIQAAVDTMANASNGLGENYWGARVLLSEGRFYVDASAYIISRGFGDMSMRIHGMGMGQTNVIATGTAGGDQMFWLADNDTLQDISFFDASTGNNCKFAGGVSTWGQIPSLRRCKLEGSNFAADEDLMFYECTFDNVGRIEAIGLINCVETTNGLTLATLIGPATGEKHPVALGNVLAYATLEVHDSEAIVSDNVFNQIGVWSQVGHSPGDTIISNNFTWALVVDGGDRVTVRDNYLFESFGFYGETGSSFTPDADASITIRNTTDTVVVGNTIQWSSGTPTAIEIESTATRTRLGYNAILDKASWTTIIVDASTTTLYPDANASSFFKGGTLATSAGVFKLPFAEDAWIIDVQLTVGTSPVGADVIVDLEKDGGANNLYTTQANRPKVVASDADGIGTKSAPDVHFVDADGYVVLDIDQVGSASTEGSDLIAVVRWMSL